MNATYADLLPQELFPRSIAYRSLLARAQLLETPARGRAFPYTERHLQCAWFDDQLRPGGLTTHAGEPVRVEHPGSWNLEAGPDFLGAVVRLDDGRRLCGDVEIHVRPEDWVQHGHASDPRYRNVRIHVTYFPGLLPEGELPPGALQVSMKSALHRDPAFAFDNIDVYAYPFAGRSPRPPCRAEFASWDADQRVAVLDAAGEERMRRKAERLRKTMEEKGATQAIYEEWCTALGYKHNKQPFRQLAITLPFEELRQAAQGDVTCAYAILLGVSGLMPADVSPGMDEEARAFARQLWDLWWKQRERFAHRTLSRAAWQLAGRPANHPARRMWSAAQLVTSGLPPLDLWTPAAGETPRAWLRRMETNFTRLAGGFWDHHPGWDTPRSDEAAAILGPDRARVIIVNVILPALAACGCDDLFRRGVLEQLPAGDSNAIIRQTAHYLFGEDVPRSHFDNGLRRQGLIQIFHDFCLEDRSRCARCLFPAMLREYAGSGRAHKYEG